MPTVHTLHVFISHIPTRTPLRVGCSHPPAPFPCPRLQLRVRDGNVRVSQHATGARVSQGNVRVDASGPFRQRQDSASDEEEAEAKVLDGGVQRGEGVRDGRRDQREVPEDRGALRARAGRP